MDIVATKPHLIFNLVAAFHTWLGFLAQTRNKAKESRIEAHNPQLSRIQCIHSRVGKFCFGLAPGRILLLDIATIVRTID